MLAALDIGDSALEHHPGLVIARPHDVSAGSWPLIVDIGQLELQLKLVGILANSNTARIQSSNDGRPGSLAHAAFSNDETDRYQTPSDALEERQSELAQRYRAAFFEAMKRLDSLKSDALSEERPVSEASEKDLVNFLSSRTFVRRPFITLLDNGNLRAIWKNSNNEQIGLQFLGEKRVQFVLFACRKPSGFVARSSGRDTFPEVWRQIEAHDLGRLVMS